MTRDQTVLAMGAEIERLRTENERLRAAIKRWQNVVEQAMACIRGETPEDVTFGEAEDDTYAKLRDIDVEMGDAIKRILER